MTAKREAELETENRMLREQVVSLEKIIERMQYPVYYLNGNALTQGAAPQPQPWTWTWPNTSWWLNTPTTTVPCGADATSGSIPAVS